LSLSAEFSGQSYETDPQRLGVAQVNIAVAYTIHELFTGWVRTFDANAEPLMDEQVIAGNHLLLTTPQLATSSCSDSLAVSWLRDDSGAARSRVYRADNDNDGTADLCCR